MNRNNELRAAGTRPNGLQNPVTARAALTTLEVIQKERLVENARRVGVYARARLAEMQTRCPQIRSVRGLGLLNAVELHKTERDRDPAGTVAVRARKMGLNLSAMGGVDLSLSPPLTITKAEIDRALEILERAIAV